MIVSSTLARRRAPEAYEEALADLGREVNQMRNMVDGLLHLARDDAAGQQAKAEYLDLAALLKDVVDALRALAEEKGLAIVDRVPEQGLYLVGDSDGLIRLFLNLMNNAVKYTEQGSIVVSAEAQDDDMVVVTISDTGVGIAASICLISLIDSIGSTSHAARKVLGWAWQSPRQLPASMAEAFPSPANFIRERPLP